MAEESKLQEYLKSAQIKITEILKEEECQTKVHIVIGNESADLDSVVSAIIYSYYRQTKVEDDANNLFIPIINIPEEDLILKTDVNAIFEKLNIQIKGNLMFRECLGDLARNGFIIEVVLLDHNSLDERLAFLQHHVTTIIDHHQDNGTIDDPCVTKTIEPVGSCCTLVAEKIYNHAEELFSQYPISELLLSAILVDTVNLKRCIGRTTEKDIEFAEDLEEYSTVAGKELFDIANEAKFNLSSLPAKDVLRKDFKLVIISEDKRIGISSVTSSAHDFLVKTDAMKEITSFTEQNNLLVFIAMFIHMENDVTKREMLLRCSNADMRQSFCRYLKGRSDLSLEEKELDAETCHLFDQGNTMASRKMVLPITVDFVSQLYLDGNASFENSNKIKDGARIEQRNGLSNDRHSTQEEIPEIEVDDDKHKESSALYTNRDNEMMNIDGSLTPVAIGIYNNEQQTMNMGHSGTALENQQSRQPDCESEARCNDICSEMERVGSPQSLTTEPVDDFSFQPNDLELDVSVDKGGLYVSLDSPRSWTIDPVDDLSFQPNDLELDVSVNKEGLDVSHGSNNEPSFRLALDEAYSDLDKGYDQPTLEFEETWEAALYDVKSPDVESRDKKHKIVIRDLSFDENLTIAQQLSGIDLLCPVFLAVTEDSDDDDVVLKDIRRKTKSIENLCSALDVEQEFPLRRTKSELPMYHKKSRKEFKERKRVDSLSERKRDMNPRQDSIQEENTLENAMQDVDAEEIVTNPFARDEEFIHESASQSSASSVVSESRFHEECKRSQPQGIPRRNQNTFSSPGLQRSANRYERPVERFSFSDNGMDIHDNDLCSYCDCEHCNSSGKTNETACEGHVTGLWDRFITVSVGGLLKVVDLRLIENYVKVITHGGFCYDSQGQRTVVMVFTAAFFPHKYIPKYDIIMEQLFYYAIHTLDLSVGDNYNIVYFNATGPNRPGRDWLNQCYDIVERRLKKNLKQLFIVHPDFWIKTMLRLYKPFISSKFSRKVKYIKSLNELSKFVSLEYIFIPDEVKRMDPGSRTLRG